MASITQYVNWDAYGADQLIAFVKGLDGHTIFSQQMLEEHGISEPDQELLLEYTYSTGFAWNDEYDGRRYMRVDQDVYEAVRDLVAGSTTINEVDVILLGFVKDYDQVKKKTFTLDDYKSTLFSDGKPVGMLSGVYGLDVLRSIVRYYNLEAPVKMGRGFQAREYQSAIIEHIETNLTITEE